MKVKELILKLKRCNPEDEVYISDHIGDTLWRGCTVDGIGGGESSEHGHWATIYKGWKVARDGSINKDIRPSSTARATARSPQPTSTPTTCRTGPPWPWISLGA